MIHKDDQPVRWESAMEWRRIVGSPYCTLPLGCKWVITVLSRYGDKWGDNVHPGQREIAFRAGVSTKSVNYNVQLAAEEGWLKRLTMGQGRGYKLTYYELTVPAYVYELRANSRRFWEPPYEFKLLKKGKQVVKVQRWPVEEG